MSNGKIYNVKEAAEFLGTSDITVRRKIKNKQIEAELISKKEGYKITEEALQNYLKDHKIRKRVSKKTDKKVAKTPALITPKKTKKETADKSMVGDALSNALGMLFTEYDDNESGELSEETMAFLSELKNSSLIDKIIERLKAEMEDFDVKIEYQTVKVETASSDKEKLKEQKALLDLKLERNHINKGIKDLEIQKSFVEQMS
ncbi:MAG: helix-turn-helix domain-containing protein [Selenomonadaceae bacterium]|nr:helix-turn-helix domain-containing protein [Selenomonadaceae bacterium]